MALKLKSKSGASVLASNKVPPLAISPEPSLFQSHAEFQDGRVIWRSFPLPDRIAFEAYLLPEHFVPKALDQKHLLACIDSLANGLAGAQIIHEGSIPGQAPGMFPTKLALPLGLRASKVFITFKKKQPKDEPLPSFIMRLEFNPRKLGPLGFKKLDDAFFQGPDVNFELNRYLADAVIKRLDVAIDYADTVPAELILSTKNQGKRVEYFGHDGILETIQIHGRRRTPKGPLKKKPSRPLGTLIVKLYDRNRERASVGKEPPLPGHQVTRLETVRTRFPKGFGLADVDGFANPFVRVALSYGPGVLPYISAPWLAYLACRRAVGHAIAAQLLGFGPGHAKSMQKAVKTHPSNLLNAKGAWSEWHQGLQATGLASFVEKAKWAKSHWP